MLTPEQQGFVQSALDSDLVPKCIDYFLKNYPCLREILTPDEMESAGFYACASAATTYDPTRAGISAYFSKAIIHELLKSCQREIKHGAKSVYRISLKAAEQRQPPESKPLTDPILRALQDMTDEDRRWIERRVFDGASFRVLAREKNVSTRQVQKLLKSKLDRLARFVVDSPHTSAWHGGASQETGPRSA